MTPPRLYPPAMPPACASIISRAVVPIGSSHRPGRFTLPLTPYSLVPPSAVRLSLRNHSAPLFTMCGTQHIVSTLFTFVGLPHSPLVAGKGGLLRGVALLPSIALSSPVSSPQM